jgi:hypothetical protein
VPSWAVLLAIASLGARFEREHLGLDWDTRGERVATDG